MSSAYSFDSDLHDEEMEMEMDFLRERYQEDNRNYDVFLSFRGEDTRASFTSHLYTALHNAGVFVFKDDETLSRGNKISPSLQLAIEESRVSVVVFSRNYAESRWCLKELEKIMECHRTTGQVVVPVFYDVDPSEVRHQTGHFGKAFRNLENRLLKVEEEELQRWWKTLAEAAGISGLSVVRNCKREIGDKICLLAQHWREALREAAGILGDSVSEFGKMDIANKIDYFVERWRDGLCVATRIPWRGMLIAEKLIDLLVKHWRETLCEALCEAVGFSDGADLYYSREIEMVYKIEPLVVNWSTALGEAAGSISGGAHLNSQGKFANEISLLMKHWREALCEHNGIPLVFLLNFSVEEEIIRDFKDLMMSWKEALREAAGISRVVVLNYRGKVKIATEERNILVKHWAETLREAASISGIVVLNSRNESEAIKTIVENITRLLNKTELFVADNPVGIEPRVQEMIELLDQKQSNDVLILGMWGMGGIGKTTIAKAIYNKIGRNFEGKSFLAHIREVWEQDAGQVYLQEQLLFDIKKETNTKIRNVESGKVMLKERLRHKRVLLILDDVNKLHQLNVLCGSREWFGSGSRIIITTRDMHILRGRRVDKVFRMKGMDEDESIELFSWHAFKQASPREDFIELSRNLVAYSAGLPLALEVLGSYLFDMEVIEWKNVLEKLKKIPNDEVQEKLKISYDGLTDDTEKGIFLDIACFFIGMDRNDVIHILNGCGLCAENGIRVLVERSLVTVDYKNKLGMHDLLRDMGREIIRSKTPMELEERSRLWFHEDALDVLSKETGTKAIEGLALKLPRNNTKCLSTKAFKEMKKLRLLQLAGVQLVGDFKYLSKDLRWLCWHGFPLACIPTNLYQGSLVSIELENSNVNLLWKEAQVMEKLKILNLSHSHYLTQTPDFSNLPNLEKLLLIDCPRLSEISYTIGHLNKVLLINFQDCISLRKLPRSIYKLKSLKALILSGCLKIDKLEEDLEQMESLTTLIADKTAITRVPFSIVRSKRIGYISLCGYEGFSRDVFPSIIWSWMSPTNSLSSRVQTFLDVSSLVSLDVPNSSSNHLSYISKDLPLLQSLCIECGSELQLSIDAANILDALYATNFEELESTAATSQMHNMNVLTLIECNNQVHNLGSKNFRRSLLIQMGTSCQVTNILKQRILQNMTTSDGGGGCLLPGDSYPDWLTFNSEGSSLTFEIPQVNGRNLKKMMCHVHYSSPENITSDGLKNLLVINHTKAIIQLYKRNALVSFEDEEWQGVLSKIEPGNKVQIVVVFWSKLTVYKTTIYLIYEPMNEKIEHSRALNKNVMDSSGEENECVVGTISLQVESIYKPTNDIMEHCHASNKNAIVSSSDENECVVGTISLQVESIYKPTNDIMEHCHASNKNAIVSSSDENACVVRPFSPQVESIDDLRCVSKKGLIKRLLNKFLSCEYFCNANSENKKNQG
ncbi:disease resistance protein RUN1 isoform X3 [Glycine max]|uniref:disease resistance protein RUN1 isoform X3 n=1 Tax=Glycine max TaxID=3847 RepID=UPI0007191ECC|nr:disease resistance protein RUN1 isoform X3 [Glycine max]|eukprot:XP_014629005.1 TMV resistance protein N isoform X3 [Glycine max]